MLWKNKIFICNFCKKEFTRRWACADRIPKHCSYECANKNLIIRTQVKCDTCQSEIHLPKYRIKKTKKYYCNIKCKANSKTINCDWCKKEFKKKPALIKINNFCSRECMGKWQSENKTKENSNSWQGGLTTKNERIRKSLQYQNWRKKVFERDNYVCQNCKERGGRLQADHILPFAYFPELRFDIGNGQTLCVPCHKETDTHGTKSITKYKNTLFAINN